MAFQIARTTFGKQATQATAQDGPPALTVRDLNRRQVMLSQAVSIVAGGLPKPCEAIHGVMTGRYDLMHVIVAILQAKGAKCEHLRIATLSYNRRNLAELLRLIDTNEVGKLSLICSIFFREHNKELYQETADELGKQDSGRTRLAAARSHCKVVAFEFTDRSTLTLEGSANLRTNGNWEQFALINDPSLCQWHAAWIDGQLDKHGTASNES